VNAIVTALHGTIPSDVSEWYIEDPNGGPHSGVAVYCDPDLAKCPKGTPYQGMMEFLPTAQTILSANATPPPIPTVSMSDVAPGGNSEYRGVLVKLALDAGALTVDNVTPTALHDTSCTTVIGVDAGPPANTDAGPSDAGTANTDAGALDSGTTDANTADANSLDAASADGASDEDAASMDAATGDTGATDAGSAVDATLADAGGGADAAGQDAATGGGMLSCATQCSPPAYSGFTAHDGTGNEINIEATFFDTDEFQSSPECLGAAGVLSVTVGLTFSVMEGVLDYDGYAKQQQLSPVTPADYTTP
jgi:hypothetical protein